jgi:glycosyltransferase involved in cell wall biosynthesis
MVTNNKKFRFKIVVPAYNCTKWLRNCLDSIERQSLNAFDVCVIDDASTDVQQQPLIEDYCRRNNWAFHFNETNQGALFNIINGITLLRPEDQDVIITLDGDDWLYNRHVLKKLYKIYSEEDVYLTYGQFITYPRCNIGSCRPVSNEIIRNRSFRKIKWVFSHPKTFKYFLWRHIKDEDLLDKDGKPFKVASDLAIMFPMLEMAAYRFRYINEFLYVYNKVNPLNDDKIHLERQQVAVEYIRSLPPYSPLFHDDHMANTDTTTLANKLKMVMIKIARKTKMVLT